MEDEVPFETERSIANQIMMTVTRLQLPLKLDSLTEGKGNCFPLAIIQQCRRPEIHCQLKPLAKIIVKHKTGQSILRSSVKQFITKSEHRNVARFRAYYEDTDAIASGRTWEEYWSKITENNTWADSWFV